MGRWQFLAWAVAAAAFTASAAGPPTIAVLAPTLPFELSRHARRAQGLMDLVQVRLDDGRVALVERQKIQKVLSEQRLVQALSAAGSLAWGRGLGADLIVLPEFLPPPDAQTDAGPAAAPGPVRDDATIPRWTLRLTVVDPEKASIVSTAEFAVPGDRDTGPESLDVERVADALANRLVADAARLVIERGRTPVAVLFFENVTPASDRLDGYGADLKLGTAAAGEAAGLRMLRFPAVAESRAEQDLAVAGFVAAGARWDEIARWWVWGEFEEVEWEARPFAEASVIVRARVWDGANEPLLIEEQGTVGRREHLTEQVAARVAAAVAAGQPTGGPQPPEKLAASLFQRALALQTENAGGVTAVNDAWLDRWRRTNRLLDLARFISPEDRTIAIEHLLSRFRRDMVRSINAAGTVGVFYLDEPEPLWLLMRARAWGEFTGRFGVEGEWPATAPGRPGLADNRAWGARSVAAQSVAAAAGLLGSLVAAPPGSMPLGQGIDTSHREPWPLDAEAVAELRTEWTGEAESRARTAIERGGADAVTAGRSLLALIAALPEKVPDRRPPPAPETITWPDVWPVKVNAGGLVLSPPFSLGTHEVAASRPLFNLEAGCAWQGDWLLVGTWRAAGMGKVVLRSSGTDRAAGRVRRIDWDGGLSSACAGLAHDGARVWLAGTADGIGHLDLADGKTRRRWGLADGLPVTSFSDIDIDPDGVPVAASGATIEPPRIVWRERDAWLARSVPTFTTEPIRPVAHRVACSRKAVVVAGHASGVSPFAALLNRDTGRWLDLRERLVAHVDREGLDLSAVLQGRRRFNALDVVALPPGGFVLLHNLGATWIDDTGSPLRTVAWPRKKALQHRGRAVLSADATRIWFAAHTDDQHMVLYELPLAGDHPPTELRVPRDPFVPLPLFDDGMRLWLPSHDTAGGDFVDVLFLPPHTTSLDTAAETRE